MALQSVGAGVKWQSNVVVLVVLVVVVVVVLVVLVVDEVDVFFVLGPGAGATGVVVAVVPSSSPHPPSIIAMIARPAHKTPWTETMAMRSAAPLHL